MRINMTQNPAALIRSSLTFGFSRAGKTVFNATWPRPAWIGSAREDGYESLRYMDRSLLYDPHVIPDVYTVSSIAEIRGHLDRDILPKVRTGAIRSIILEISTYRDDVVVSTKRLMKGDANSKENGWAIYGTLEEHVMLLDAELKKYPHLHVAYNALATPPTDKVPGGIVIAGRKLPEKLPPMCQLVGYLRQEEFQGKVDRVLHLSAYGGWSPGHRFGALLPNFVRNPTYRGLEQLLRGEKIVDGAGNIIDRPPPQVQVPVTLPPLGGSPPIAPPPQGAPAGLPPLK